MNYFEEHLETTGSLCYCYIFICFYTSHQIDFNNKAKDVKWKQRNNYTWKSSHKYRHIFVKFYLCYKTITSQKVSSEAQVKNFFVS